MKKFDAKIVSSAFALVLGAFVSSSPAAQIQAFVSGYAPGDVNENQDQNGTESNSTLHSDFMWGLGVEALALPVGPLMIGGGIGFLSLQTDGGDNVVMPAIPLFASIGLIGPETWPARPYLEARVGYPIPASSLETWWNEPTNFFVGGNVGVQLPYHMGVEFNCSYLTMNKNFSDEKINFRLSSMKIGGSITVHFDLSGSPEEPAEKPAETVASAVESSNEEFSYGYGSSYEDESSESSSYGDSYGEDSSDSGSEDQASSDDSTEETSAEETPAEEAAPAAEPAPEPKPVAKKSTSKKASSKKKLTKKSKKSSKTTKKKTRKK